jgi:hypothetical protein
MSKFGYIIEKINSMVSTDSRIDDIMALDGQDRLDLLGKTEFAIITSDRADGHNAAIGQEIKVARDGGSKEEMEAVLARNKVEVDEGNAAMRPSLEDRLKSSGFSYMKVVGKFPEDITGVSTTEVSFLVLLDEDNIQGGIDTLNKIAQGYKQDSILVGSGTQTPRYSFVSETKIDPLGSTLVPATSSDAYSTMFKDGQYFTVS